MSYQKLLLSGSALLLAMASAVPVHAQSSELEVEILQLLVDEGIIPFEKAQTLLMTARRQQEEKAAAEAAAAETDAIDVPYIPDVIRLQIKEEVEADVIERAKSEGWIAPNTLPDWVERITVSGDLRARFQYENFPDSELGPNGELIEGNFPFFPDVAEINRLGGVTDADGFPLLNSTVDRQRPNYRARLKFEADVNDYVTVAMSVASGDDSSPISTNSTFGEYFYKESLWLDQAYVDVTPVKGLHVTAGRMPNPFYSTNLIWDTDINPEGLAISGSYPVLDETLSVFGVGAALPMQERSLFDDTYLYAGQLGAEGEFADVLQYKAALSYYYFDNIQSLKNPADGSRINDWSAPRYLSKGNSVFNMRTDGLTTLAGLAAEYELIALTGRIAYANGPRQYGLTAEVVQNQALDEAEIAALRGEPGVEPGDLGWQVTLDAGYPVVKAPGEWRVAASYRYLETDAVLDVFTDSDFGLGGTDLEGYILEGEYGVYANTSVGAAILSSDSINRPPFALDIFQLNLKVQF